MSALVVFTIFCMIRVSSSACTTDEDCYLRGECINSACKCDNWSKGENCQLLNLAPVNKQKQGYLNKTGPGGYNTWGGHPIKVNGTYHLFAAQIINHCLLNKWTTSSEIIRAESDNHLGPYQMKQVIFPTFAHNPQITQAPDGTYLLYYIGIPNNISINCTNTTSSSTHSIFDVGVESIDNTSVPQTSGGPIRLGWSKSVYGPWQTKTIVDSQEWHTSTNPSPYMYPNGTVLLVVSRRWCDAGYYNASNGECSKYHKDTWLMYADDWSGPYKNVSIDNQDSLDINHMSGADPFIFKTKRGFQMLFNAGGYCTGWFAYSTDPNGASNWTLVEIDSFNGNISYTDGSYQQLCARQRPQILFDEESGEPMSLWNGATVHGQDCSSNWINLPTWTLAEPFVGYE